MGPDQTGVLTDTTSVNPAPAQQLPTAPQPPVFPYTVATNTTPALSSDPTALAKYEERVRSLMSEKDKARNDFERAVQERLEVTRERDELRQNLSNVTTGSAQAIEQVLNESKAKDTELAKTRAQNAKLQALMAAPELAPYSALIPETEDVTQLQAVITQLKEVRQRDIEAQLASRVPQTPPQAPTRPEDMLAQLRGVYPSQTYVPPATPAAPSGMPSANAGDQAKMLLDQALRESADKNDSSIFERALAAQAQIAEAQARQQYGSN